MMLHILLLTTILFYDPGVNLTPYLSLLPAECPVRIDITSSNNIYYDGYAWYSGRITIYDGNNMDYDRKRFVLAHELGHICAVNNTAGSYDDREQVADDYAYKLLEKNSYDQSLNVLGNVTFMNFTESNITISGWGGGWIAGNITTTGNWSFVTERSYPEPIEVNWL